MDANDFDSDEDNFVAESQDDDQMMILTTTTDDNNEKMDQDVITIQEDQAADQADTVENKEQQGDRPSEERMIRVGDFVVVESRTWPGMNKQGGAGRITSIKRPEIAGW